MTAPRPGKGPVTGRLLALIEPPSQHLPPVDVDSALDVILDLAIGPAPHEYRRDRALLLRSPDDLHEAYRHALWTLADGCTRRALTRLTLAARLLRQARLL